MSGVCCGSSFARAARQQPLNMLADGMFRGEQQSSMIRCLRRRAATSLRVAQHPHTIPRLCAWMCLADSPTASMLFAYGMVFFVIRLCSRLRPLATHDLAGPSVHPRSAASQTLWWLLESGEIGRWNARGQRTALCAAPYVPGVFRRVEAASGCRHLLPHACLRHGVWQWSSGGLCAAVGQLVRALRAALGCACVRGFSTVPVCEIARDITRRGGDYRGSRLD